MLILIELLSILIVCWLGDWKLIYAYLTETAFKISTSWRCFENLKLIILKHSSICFYQFVYIYFIQNDVNAINVKNTCLWKLMRECDACADICIRIIRPMYVCCMNLIKIKEM